MSELKVDWDSIASGLKSDVTEGLRGLVEGAESDLKEFGAAIALDMIRAVREKREDLLEELKHQLAGIAEINRIRTVNATWEQIGNILAMVGRVAMKAVAGVAIGV